MAESDVTRFTRSQSALLPAFPEGEPAVLRKALAEGGPRLEALIAAQHLGPLWHARTGAAAFGASRVNAALLYLGQRAAVRDIDDLFSRGGIRYAIIKGVATRELIFDEPAVRGCSDIDILVAPGQRVDAARVLVASGYQLRMDPSLASHEIVLAKGGVAIDLHWDILRPGRTRVPVTESLLARRRRHDGTWMLSDDDALFLMLVHDAVAKHVSTSVTGLHRVADLVLWLQRRTVDWPAVRRQLEACGLKTAAWTVLCWVRSLAPASFSPLIESPIHSLQPGRLRAAYLRSWLRQDLSTRLNDWHAVRLLAFSAFLHDRPSDAWHALRGWRRSKATADTDAQSFAGLTN